MAPYLLLADWRFLGASNTTAGIKQFLSERNPVWKFILNHASDFVAWVSQPRKPHQIEITPAIRERLACLT